MSDFNWIQFIKDTIKQNAPLSWEEWVVSGHLRESAFRERIEKWIEAHNSKDVQVARRLANQIRYISVNEMFSELRTASAWVSGVMGDNNLFSISSPSKSNGWLTKSAISMIQQRRKIIYRGDFLSERDSSPNDEYNVCIFDDAMYSGQQVCHNIGMAVERAKRNDLLPIRILVAIPFATKAALNRLLELKRDLCDSVSIEVYPGIKYLDSAADLAINAAADNKISRGDSEERVGTGWNHSMSLTIFDHKVPDSVSFPLALRLGCLIKNNEICSLSRTPDKLDMQAILEESGVTIEEIMKEAAVTKEPILEIINKVAARYYINEPVQPFVPLFDMCPYRYMRGIDTW
jgi:hypothetical protein